MSQLTQPAGIGMGSGIGREAKYLTFSLDAEEYGIGILKIKEIIGMIKMSNARANSCFGKYFENERLAI